MFELEQAISEWRHELTSRGVKRAEIVDELENHLRDDVEEQIGSGLDAETAFTSALARIGELKSLRMEFKKLGYEEILQQLKSFFLTLLGVPNNRLIINMNTTSSDFNVEPRWATYIKASTFLAPSLILWSFSCVYLMPKLKQICGHAGFALPAILQVTLFATSNAVLISAGLIILIFVFEWRSNTWPKYRRTVIGGGVFVVNALVLLVITMMVFSALVAAPAMAHSAK